MNKPAVLFSTTVLVLLCCFVLPAAAQDLKPVLTIYNRTDKLIHIDKVLCNGRDFGFAAAVLVPNMGTSEAGELLTPGSTIDITGAIELAGDPSPDSRTRSTMRCTLKLSPGIYCTLGEIKTTVTKDFVRGFDSWSIEFK